MALSKLTDIRKSLSVEVEDLQVNGITTFTGSVSIGGTLTYEDVTNIDSVGVITARSDINLGDSIIHIGDTNTKIRFPAADTITAETAGSEKLRITAAGDVGIGTTNPNNPITVHGSGNHIFMKDTATNNVFQIRSSGDVAEFNTYGTGGARKAFVFNQYASEVLRINSSGYVGVKRSTPLANLHTTNNELALGANPTSAAAPNATYDGLVVDGEAASFINIRSRGNGSDSYGRLAFSDDVRSRAYVEYRHKDGGGDDTMRFATAGGERLRIDSSGRVQIGASNNTGSHTKLVVGAGNNINTTAIINTGDVDTNALTLSNWDGAQTSNKVMISFDNSGRGSFAIGMPAASADFAFFAHPDAASEEKLRITSAGLVGISTNAPSAAWLDIATGSGSYDHIRMRRLSSDSNVASNWSMKPYAGNLYFRTGGSTDKIYFDDSGDLNIMDGNLIMGTAGHGIDFAATSDASGNTSELLDDYEEGSWTPDIKGRTGGSFSIRVGQYTKVGRMVSCTCHVNISSLTSSNGAFVVNGLPFTSANITNNYSVTSSVHFNNSFSIGGDRGMFNGLVAPNAGEVAFYYKNAATITAVAASDFGSGNVLFEITYMSIS